ncbi:MAG: SH3 domain-containing protein [Acidobacteriota bacterium]|nr:SH3 domain-containing protein [Acidobacteriota bacterium]
MKQKIIYIGLLLLFLGVSIDVSAQKERFVRPVDEGKQDKSFSAFRVKLIEAVKKRDKKYLLSVLDPNVKNSFGGDGGIEEFKEMWEIDSSKSKLWDELRVVLSNGGGFQDKNTFAAPYSFVFFPADLDAFEQQVIFGNNVNLRAKPDKSAKVISQLSYNIVKVDYENSVSDGKQEPTYLWLKVETLGGKKGFVSAEFVRSSIDYRAIFVKEKGKWKISAFVAGD